MSTGIKSKIKAGKLPRWTFAKNKDGSLETKANPNGKKEYRMVDGKIEAVAKEKYTWRIISTEAYIEEQAGKDEV